MKTSFSLIAITLLLTLFSSVASVKAQERVTPDSIFNLPSRVSATLYTGNVIEPILEESETEFTDDSFNFKVQWPTTGPKELIKNLREIIIDDLSLHANTEFSNIPTPAADNFPQIAEAMVDSYVKQDKNAEMGYSRSFDIDLISTDKTVTVKSETEQLFLNIPHAPYSLNISVFDAASGAEIDYSIFPPIEKVRKLLIDHLYNGEEKVREPKEYQIEDISNLPYPENLPIFENDGLTFIWYIYEIAPRPFGIFTAKIPYTEFKPYASDELLKLFPN